MSERPLFSIVTLVRNETKRLSVLAESLEPFLKAGGNWVVADSASTDGTRDFARKLGATVVRLGERFRVQQSDAEAKQMAKDLHIPAEEPSLFFDFGGARNAAARHTRCDQILVLDSGDQVHQMDIPALNRMMQAGGLYPITHYLGLHNKHNSVRFYDRRSWTYRHRAHEFLQALPDAKVPPAARTPIPESMLKVVYIRQTNTARAYLVPMYMDWKENPQSHRCHFYLARRLYYNKKWAAAIKMFEQGLFGTHGWCAEMSQAAVYCGICYVHLGKLDKARERYLLALDYDASRREPWLRLAYIAQAKGKWAQMRGFLAGLMATPRNIQLYESEANYGILPKQLMYTALVKLQDYQAALPYWQECRKALPTHTTYHSDAHLFEPLLTPKKKKKRRKKRQKNSGNP